MKKGLFVGTFDPFTIGHASIVKRALTLFDGLVIGVGVNEKKCPGRSADKRKEAIEKLYADDGRIEVRTYAGLTVDLARQCEVQFLVKGIRSVKDFEYEREQADVNRRLSGLETVFLMAEPGMESVSSSLVRELEHFGHDVSEWLPKRR